MLILRGCKETGIMQSANKILCRLTYATICMIAKNPNREQRVFRYKHRRNTVAIKKVLLLNLLQGYYRLLH